MYAHKLRIVGSWTSAVDDVPHPPSKFVDLRLYRYFLMIEKNHSTHSIIDTHTNSFVLGIRIRIRIRNLTFGRDQSVHVFLICIAFQKRGMHTLMHKVSMREYSIQIWHSSYHSILVCQHILNKLHYMPSMWRASEHSSFNLTSLHTLHAFKFVHFDTMMQLQYLTCEIECAVV